MFDTYEEARAFREKSHIDMVLEIGRDSVVVQSLLSSWRRGDITFERALAEMVICLHKHNKHLQNELLKKLQNEPPPSIIINRTK